MKIGIICYMKFWVAAMLVPAMAFGVTVKTLAARTGCSLEEALRRFYESHEYHLVSNGISDQHCMTPDYIVDDILAETV